MKSKVDHRPYRARLSLQKFQTRLEIKNPVTRVLLIEVDRSSVLARILQPPRRHPCNTRVVTIRERTGYHV